MGGPNILTKHNMEWDLILFYKAQPEKKPDAPTETQPGVYPHALTEAQPGVRSDATTEAQQGMI